MIKKFTNQIGLVVIERLVNATTKDTSTSSVVTLWLPKGTIRFTAFYLTNSGKGITGNIEICPVNCGSKRYLYWNSSKYSAKLKFVSDDDRTITIFKTCL